MAKGAIVVFADTESHGDLGRVVNALVTAKEFKGAGDDVQVIFDGAGTKWIGELAKADHPSHGLYEGVKDKVAGVCAFCASAFGAKDAVQKEGLHLLDEYQQHPSLRSLIVEGYAVLIF